MDAFAAAHFVDHPVTSDAVDIESRETTALRQSLDCSDLSEAERDLIINLRQKKEAAARAGIDPEKIQVGLGIPLEEFHARRARASSKKNWKGPLAQMIGCPKKQFDAHVALPYVPLDFALAFEGITDADLRGSSRKEWSEEENSVLSEMKACSDLVVAKELTRRFPARKRLESSVKRHRSKMKVEEANHGAAQADKIRSGALEATRPLAGPTEQ